MILLEMVKSFGNVREHLLTIVLELAVIVLKKQISNF